MTENALLNEIDQFEAQYQYDSTYMRDMLKYSKAGYSKFSSAMPLSSHREKLTVDEYWVAKLAAMQVEDCGECLQLNIRMAVEAGVDRDIIENCIKYPNKLSPELNDIHEYTCSIVSRISPVSDLLDRITARYDQGTLLELGLCIASSVIYPVIKRTAGYAKSCSMIEINI